MEKKFPHCTKTLSGRGHSSLRGEGNIQVVGLSYSQWIILYAFGPGKIFRTGWPWACFPVTEVVGISSPGRLLVSTWRNPFTPALKVK